MAAEWWHRKHNLLFLWLYIQIQWNCLVNKTAMGFKVWKPSANSGLRFSSGFLLCMFVLPFQVPPFPAMYALWNMPTLKQNWSLCLESPLLLESLKLHQTLFWNDLLFFYILLFLWMQHAPETFVHLIFPHTQAFLSLLWNLAKAQDRQTRRQKKLLCQRSALKGAYLGGCMLL